MRKRIPAFLFLIIFPSLLFAQRYNKRFRWEAGLDLGATNFLGELGGANQIGTHGVKDLELSLTKPCFGVHMRYKSQGHFAYCSSFMYGKVSGNDALTTEKFRHNRNLNFKSNIFEFNATIEFFLTKERPGHIYHYKKLHGWRNIDIQEYLFTGIGGFYFNPKSYYSPTKKWYALQPLRTEGEGLRPGTKKYSLVSVCIPVGAGFKYGIDRQRKWSIGLEFGIRYTFTDYIDDVSTTYYDPNAIKQANGSMGNIAAYFADPSLHQIPTSDGIGVTDPGQQRGDSTHNDAYMFMQVTVNYKIGRWKKTHSKF